MAMTADENPDSESETKEPPFGKIAINTDYKIKTSLEEPPTDPELKPLPDNLEYVFLEEPSFLPVIISSQLSAQNKGKLISVLKKHKEAFAWKTTDIPGICPSFCKHKIQLLDDKKPVVQKRLRGGRGGGLWRWRGLGNMKEVVKKEIVSLSLSGYRRMPFGLCNAPTTFQRCMLAIFPDMIEESIEVFMDDFSVFGNSFDKCLNNLDKMLQRCKDAHLVLNWEKCHFMVKEGIVLGHKVSSAGLEVNKEKINFLEKDTPFEFNDECQKAFESLKEKLACAPVIVSPNWNLPFELMCDASDFAVGVVLSQKDEIKDRKGTENVASDHLSRNENDELSDDSEVDDNFPRETLMEINTKVEPWFADFANFLVADIIPKGMTYQQKNKFFSDLKHYFWEEPYLFKNAQSSNQRPSGQVENTNKALKRILEKTVKDNPVIWSRKLDDAL
ncbi:reverse transcriptase domain-containing protein [Tanacetum coccineum]